MRKLDPLGGVTPVLPVRRPKRRGDDPEGAPDARPDEPAVPVAPPRTGPEPSSDGPSGHHVDRFA